jgi:O-antigen/teichoic acid export membrane protein
MVAMILEISMICRGRYGLAAVTYAVSDALRGVGFIVPVLLGAGIRGLLWGAVAATALRVLAMAVYARREYGPSLRPDLGLLRPQLAYALPFGAAIVVEILVANLHQYFVSSHFDVKTFAIYAAGCLSIPFVDFVAVPAGDVMMVKMREALAAGRPAQALAIWRETTGKLALAFFPMVAGALVVARELIVTVYTPAYAASAPVFVAWSLAILFSAIPVDGVLRVQAQTRFLVAMNLMRLLTTVSLIGGFVGRFHLVGAVAVTLVATLVARIAGLLRVKAVAAIGWGEVLPWGDLARIAVMAGVSAVPALVVKSRFPDTPLVALAAAGLAYSATYALLAATVGPLRAYGGMTPWPRLFRGRTRIEDTP